MLCSDRGVPCAEAETPHPLLVASLFFRPTPNVARERQTDDTPLSPAAPPPAPPYPRPPPLDASDLYSAPLLEFGALSTPDIRFASPSRSSSLDH